jgi:hypothetical protein
MVSDRWTFHFFLILYFSAMWHFFFFRWNICCRVTTVQIVFLKIFFPIDINYNLSWGHAVYVWILFEAENDHLTDTLVLEWNALWTCKQLKCVIIPPLGNMVAWNVTHSIPLSCVAWPALLILLDLFITLVMFSEECELRCFPVMQFSRTTSYVQIFSSSPCPWKTPSIYLLSLPEDVWNLTQITQLFGKNNDVFQ